MSSQSSGICTGLDRRVRRVVSGPPGELEYDHIAHDSEADKDDAPSTEYKTDYSTLPPYPPTSDDHPSRRHPPNKHLRKARNISKDSNYLW